MLRGINDDIARVQKSWSKTQIIRYLYVKLAPYFKRDIEFFFASYEEKLRQCQMGFINRGYDICCSTISDYYVDLFAEFGIRAKKVQVTDKEIPLYAVIAEGDDGWFYLDPLNDLFHNQYGLQTTQFGDYPTWSSSILKKTHPELISYSKDDLLDIDESIKLYPYGTLDGFFQTLHEDFTNWRKVIRVLGMNEYDRKIAIERKLELCSKLFVNLGNVQGIIERGHMYEYLLRRLFDRSERSVIDTSFHEKEKGIYTQRVHILLPNEEEILYDEFREDGIYSLKRVK